MEYKVNVGQGKVVWYKLKNGNDVPMMVSHLLFFHLNRIITTINIYESMAIPLDFRINVVCVFLGAM